MNPPDELISELLRVVAADEAALIAAFRLCSSRRKRVLLRLAKHFAGLGGESRQATEEAEVIPLRQIKAAE